MPLVPLTGAWLAGVLLGVLGGGLTPGQAGVALGAALLTLALLPLLWPDLRARWTGLLLLALWLGLARSLLALPDPLPSAGSLRALNVPAGAARSAAAPRRHLRGRLLADPVPARNGKASQVRIAIEAVQDGGAWRPIAGDLLALAPPFLDAGQGDLVECAGVVQDPPAVPGFDYPTWLAQHGIASYISQADVQVLAPDVSGPAAVLARWRHDAGERTAALLPEPEAGLLRAIVLGQRKAVDPALSQDFTASGAAWIIVVSGVHLLLLLLLVLPLLRRVLPPWPSVVLTGTLVTLYAFFVGFGVPVARAAFMCALVLIARGLGRPATALNLLALAALIMTAIDPLTVADAGFQLSFASVAGIILLAPPLLARGRRWPVVGDLIAVAVAVQVAIWPLIALHFGAVQPYAVPVGVAGSLLLEVVMPLGTLQELAGWVWAPLGVLFGWFCWLPLFLLQCLVQKVGALPFAAVTLPSSAVPATLLWYPLLGVWYLRRPAAHEAVRAVFGAPRPLPPA